MFAWSGRRRRSSATDGEQIRVGIAETVRQDRPQGEGELVPDVGVEGPGLLPQRLPAKARIPSAPSAKLQTS